MRQESDVTVHGPYQHGRRFRIVVRRGGASRPASFATEAEAEKFKAEVLRQAATRTVSDAIEAHVDDMRTAGLSDTSWPTTRCRLRSLLGVGPTRDGGALAALTEARAKALYSDYRERPTRLGKPPAPDTLRNTLVEAGTFARWCIDRGWLKRDPFAGIKEKARRRRGKPQLRVNEARSITDVCLARAAAGDTPAIAVAVVFLLGLRASEVATREVRDLDDDGRLFVVPEAKSEDGKRRIEVPEVLRPLLLDLARNQLPTAPLFRKANGAPATRYWLAYHVERLHQVAGVPRVTPHGLRGTHMTIARAAGQSAVIVAASVGHAGTAVQDAHYVDGEAIAAVTRNQVLRVVRGGRP
jgi:integrase